MGAKCIILLRKLVRTAGRLGGVWSLSRRPVRETVRHGLMRFWLALSCRNQFVSCGMHSQGRDEQNSQGGAAKRQDRIFRQSTQECLFNAGRRGCLGEC